MHNNPAAGEDWYGRRLHIYRSLEFRDGFDEAELAHVRGGGILWYNINSSFWNAERRDADETLDTYISNIKSLAPAQVFVCISHECEQHASETITPEMYRDLWRHCRDYFDRNAVTNVVWCMDYAAQIFERTSEDVIALWPGDDLVDWLFFNVFEKSVHKKDESWHEIVSGIYSFFEENSQPPHVFTNKPWGIGAFGAHEEAGPERHRRFFEEAHKAFEADEFPRLRALVSYDSQMSAVRGDILPAYKKYVGSTAFVDEASQMVVRTALAGAQEDAQEEDQLDGAFRKELAQDSEASHMIVRDAFAGGQEDAQRDEQLGGALRKELAQDSEAATMNPPDAQIHFFIGDPPSPRTAEEPSSPAALADDASIAAVAEMENEPMAESTNNIFVCPGVAVEKVTNVATLSSSDVHETVESTSPTQRACCIFASPGAHAEVDKLLELDASEGADSI